ncbi:MAG: hypothetical protein M0P09_01260 [Acholeplasmataceae bacterium]|nr:hypothetical protein [Acholeplasmataceae bacterium]
MSGDRGGMGGPISWVAIKDYAHHYELEPDQYEALVHHLRAMDVAAQDVRDKKDGQGK